MGNHKSTKPPKTSLTNELNSYEPVFKLDEDLQSFDTSLKTRTSHVINSLTAGIEVRALSFDSLKEVTKWLSEMDQEVVKVILEYKKDIWKKQELRELVKEYFESSKQTLNFCTILEQFLQRARNSQSLILFTLQQYEEENRIKGNNRYAKTLAALKNFKALGYPFTKEFVQVFQSIYQQQKSMLEKLTVKKKKLDKKLRYICAWRKVSSIIFITTFASLLICSIAAAVILAPEVVAALAALVPLVSTGICIDSPFKNYEKAVRGQKETLSSMQVGTYVAIMDFDNIQVLVDRLEIGIESLLNDADFAIRGKAVKMSIDEIKKKLVVFKKNVEDLGGQADLCSRHILKARTEVLQRIINGPKY